MVLTVVDQGLKSKGQSMQQLNEHIVAHARDMDVASPRPMPRSLGENYNIPLWGKHKENIVPYLTLT